MKLAGGATGWAAIPAAVVRLVARRLAAHRPALEVTLDSIRPAP